MEEYLDTLLAQIRCRKARPFIREELQQHIEEEMAANMAAGMTREAAEQAAVREMGDPEETGLSLDRVHRPRLAWGLLAIILLISAAGIVLHSSICRTVGVADVTAAGSARYAGYALLGLLLMLLVYRLDYTWLAKYAKVIAVALLALAFWGGLSGGVNGSGAFLHFGAFHFSLFPLLLLYVPVYGALLYAYRGQGKAGLWKSLAWLLAPLLAALWLPNLPLAFLLLFSLSALLSLAVAKGCFAVAKKRTLCLIWALALGLPLLGIGGGWALHLLGPYREALLRSFFLGGEENGAGYVTAQLRMRLAESDLFGTGGTDALLPFPELNSDFVLNHLFSSWGIVGAGLCLCLMLLFLLLMFRLLFRQKNQLGCLMGFGCAMVFSLTAALNVLQNLCLLPVTQSFLPFFSAGGSGILLSYLLAGIVLSVYRYKDIYPQHVSLERPRLRIRLSVER